MTMKQLKANITDLIFSITGSLLKKISYFWGGGDEGGDA